MPFMPRSRPVRIVAGLALAFALVLGVLVYLVQVGGYALSDTRMIWRMVRGGGIDAPTPEVALGQLSAPRGWSVSMFATGLPSARMLTASGTGDVIVAQPRGGLVVLLERDADGDGRSDGRRTLFAGLDRPNGVDLHGGWLYVAEATRVSRVRFDAPSRSVQGALQPVVTGLGGEGNHWRKTARIGPDGLLYVGLGSTCNVCIESDPQRATIWVYAADGSGGREFATGLRNPTGFDWAPWDGGLFATENGRDLMGDDIPPDELNRIEDGAFYGWPFVHGDGIVDPQYGQGQAARIAASRRPVHAFRAHNAPLGVRFLRHPARGAAYEKAALAALHGSWNRSVPDGYAVVSLHWDESGRVEERPFLTGFRGANGLIGRPVDVVEGPEGAVYVSDDYAGVIYRITPPPPPQPSG